MRSPLLQRTRLELDREEAALDGAGASEEPSFVVSESLPQHRFTVLA